MRGDRALTVEGRRVVRITWRQLHHRRATLAAELGALLAQPPTPTLKESAHRPMTGPAPMDGCAEQPRDGRLYEPLP